MIRHREEGINPFRLDKDRVGLLGGVRRLGTWRQGGRRGSGRPDTFDTLQARNQSPTIALQRAVERKFPGGRVARAVKVEAGKEITYQAFVSLGPDRAVGWVRAKPDGQVLGASELSPPGAGAGR